MNNKKNLIMKLSVIILTAVLSFATITSKAADGKISAVVLNSFNTSFANASEIKWTVTADYYKADFSYNGIYISAFYDGTGEMMAMTRNLSPVQLPMSLQSSVKKHAAGYWISDLFEINNESGTTYYITLENADSVVIMKAGLGGDWTTYKKQTKS
jgi:hypothetical protein